MRKKCLDCEMEFLSYGKECPMCLSYNVVEKKETTKNENTDKKKK